MEIAPYSDRLDLETQCKNTFSIDNNEVERIKPKQNRFVLIDSAQTHRVTNIYQGTRKNLATSIWKKTPKLFQEHENWNRLFSNPPQMQEINWQEKNNSEFN